MAKLLEDSVFFRASGVIEESGLYSPEELRTIEALWKKGELLGNFAIGTQLAADADFNLGC